MSLPEASAEPMLEPGHVGDAKILGAWWAFLRWRQKVKWGPRVLQSIC